MESVYVERNLADAVARPEKIKGVYTGPQPGYAEEALPADHADVVEYWAWRDSLNVA